MENKLTAHGARARWRTWRRCLRGQRRARSIPRRWSRPFFNDTARGWRLQLSTVSFIASSSWAVLPARASPRGEPANRLHSTWALADLAWLSSRPMRGTLHPTPLAEALLHRHRVRSAATASRRRNQSVQVPWRAACARFSPSRTSRPPTRHARTGGFGMVAWSMRGALHPTPLTEALLHRHRARSAAAASDYYDYTFQIPGRAATRRFAP